jgi:methyl-accepting chemotaxis protein
MLHMNFRIGTKLAISAGLGVLLVAGMVGNEMRVYRLINNTAVEVAADETVQKALLDAEMQLRRTTLQQREIRLARSAAEIESNVKRLGDYVAAGNAAYERASEAELDATNDAVIVEAKGYFKGYVDSSKDLAAVSSEILALRTEFAERGVDWGKKIDAVLAAPAFAHGEQDSLLLVLRRADSEFKQAQILFDAYVLRNGGVVSARNIDLGKNDDSAMLAEVNRLADAAAKDLQQVRAGADPELAKAVAALANLPVEFNQATAKLVSAFARLVDVARSKLDPIRFKAEEFLAKARDSAKERAVKLDERGRRERSTAEMVDLGGGGIIIALLIGSAVFVSLTIGRPIRRVGEVLMALAGGNKQVDIPYAARGDEVGEAARAAKAFKDNLLYIEKIEVERRESEAHAAAEQAAEVRRLADNFESAIGGVVETVSSASEHLEGAASTLTQTASSTLQLSTGVAAASEQASANVQTVAAAAEELSASVTEVGRQAQESSKIAGEAVTQARKTDARISDLSQAAQRIGDVVKLITAIAEQTNLLALNATIEAARAGEAGKGFAVVASEVKMLANQTAKATDEIVVQIAGMQAATNDSVVAIKEIGGTIERISEIAASIAAAVEEQGATTFEIARNVQHAAQGTAQVAGNIGEVSSAATETGSAATQVLTSAKALSSEGAKLKAEVRKFLNSVRAG